MIFDLEKLKIDPNDFDEMRILFRNTTGDATFQARLNNYPATDMVRNWYGKIALPQNELIDLRFDFRRDDDGWCFLGDKKYDARKLEVTLRKNFRRTPGEPALRETEVSAIEFIRRPAEIEFDEMAAKLSRDKNRISWTYKLNILNREARKCDLTIKLNASGLKHFKADWTELKLSLEPREKRCIELTLTAENADKLSPLYSESVIPELRVANSEAPAIFPLIGYRPRKIYATVPMPNAKLPDELPENEKAKEALLAAADKVVASPFAVDPIGPPAYCASYKPNEMEALSFFRIRDKKTKEDLSQQIELLRSYVYHHNAQTFNNLKLLGQAYKLSGNLAYAEKARDILLEYLHWYKYLPARSPASTSGGSRLASSTLDLSYFLAKGVQGYAMVRDSAAFGPADREKIETEFFAPEIKNLYEHNIEFTNMQLHHFSAYGSSVIALDRYWNLLGDALYGSHGFYKFIEYGFTADGMGLEGGVYHPFGFIPLLEFAEKIRNCGIEIIDGRFKIIFDHGIYCTPQGIADGNLRSTYPLAWQLFKDEKYLPTLKVMKQLPAEAKDRDIPEILLTKTTQEPNNGYVWLRELSPYGFRALAINYIMPWDRLEHDRLHFRLFDHGMLSHEVYRFGYTYPGADMEATVSHNTIVVDEKNSASSPAKLAKLIDRPLMPGALFTEEAASRLYEGLDFSRVTAIFDGIMFVGDRQNAGDGKKHSFDWPFYAPWVPGARPDIGTFDLPVELKTPFESSYKYVKSALSASAPGDLSVSVKIPVSTQERGPVYSLSLPSDRDLRIVFALPQPTTVVKFEIGRGHPPAPGPMLLLRQNGSSAEFAAAFEVIKTNEKAHIKSVKSLPFTPANPLSAVWEVNADSGIYLIVVNRSGKTIESVGRKFAETLEIIKL